MAGAWSLHVLVLAVQASEFRRLATFSGTYSETFSETYAEPYSEKAAANRESEARARSHFGLMF